jgi:hypothetical protein
VLEIFEEGAEGDEGGGGGWGVAEESGQSYGRISHR